MSAGWGWGGGIKKQMEEFCTGNYGSTGGSVDASESAKDGLFASVCVYVCVLRGG